MTTPLSFRHLLDFLYLRKDSVDTTEGADVVDRSADAASDESADAAQNHTVCEIAHLLTYGIEEQRLSLIHI